MVTTVLGLALAGLLGQEPRPVFRSGAHLIVQTVSVKDTSGQPVTGLTADDFVVTEDGAPQPIAFVEFQPLDGVPSNAPARADTVTPLARDTAAPAVPGDARYRGRRLLVLYFDRSNMPPFDQLRVYAAADRFIAASMQPADLVAVMAFQDGALRLQQDFTDDRVALRSLLRRLADTADQLESGIGANWDPGGAFGEDNDTFSLFTTDRQLSALQTAVSGLAPLPEVKTLVYFGSGLRLTGADNQAQLRATINAAVRSNVTINPIDTRGLTATPPLGDATRASPGGEGMFNGMLVQAAIDRQQQARDSYYALAKDTGGRALFDDNDLSRGIVEAVRAVTAYYMIGYYTTNSAADGRFRRVKISLKAGRSAELSYRPGYYAAKAFAKFNAADKERQLEEAFRLEDPITDIPMALEVNVFKLNRAEYFVPISVRMPGGELTRPRAGGSSRTEIDMLAEIKDDHGVTIQNMKDRLEFTLDAAVASQAARRPLQYETGFTLLPGSYVVKVLARDASTGRIGTFETPFTVPNLEREPVRLPISTVVLTAQRTAAAEALFNVKQRIAADVANPLVADGRKLIPGVTRTFAAGRPIFAYLEAYEHDAAAMRPLVAFLSVYRGEAVVFEADPVPIATGWNATSKGVPVGLTIPAGSLKAGVYECQVTVLDPAARRAAFWRATITVNGS